MTEHICFYYRKKQFQSLSNFSPHLVTIDNRKYLTGEHCFHGEKYYLIGNNTIDTVRKQNY